MTVNTTNAVKISAAGYSNSSNNNCSSSNSNNSNHNNSNDNEIRFEIDSSELLNAPENTNHNDDIISDGDLKCTTETKTNLNEKFDADIDLSLLSTVHVCAAQVRR